MSQSVPDRRLDDDRAARLARVCADIAQVGDLLGPEPAQALARLRDRSVSDRGVDAVLAEVTELMRLGGLLGGDTAARGHHYLPLAGVHGRRPEVVLVCPGDLCDRVEIPRPDAGPPPRCAVWDCPLPTFRMDR
ncbi:hypothetical protein ACGFIW_16980 [Micromonospora sp. NPDC048935]|uniref:hypothetical protein n=1 Tax=Micromonospora sp. NPDC048935 TaxID=3364262 RepID=UPI00370F892A